MKKEGRKEVSTASGLLYIYLCEFMANLWPLDIIFSHAAFMSNTSTNIIRGRRKKDGPDSRNDNLKEQCNIFFDFISPP